MNVDRIKGKVSTRIFIVFAALALFVIASAPVMAEESVSGKDLVEKARLDAEKAKSEAQKAMAEAEKALTEAEAAIAIAESHKEKAKEIKDNAMSKMVEAGYFPDDITLENKEGTSKAVFSHKKHTTREKLKCMECHPKLFIMKVGKDVVKKGRLTMEEMKKGKYCGSCHNGKKAFSINDIKHCRKCHPKSK
ncbi:MAG: cytochrome c3 family protein [Desulfobulbaceae bacterium]|nr:cytochrome c3 family protein [Desulfobulbaceae bacterium]